MDLRQVIGSISLTIRFRGVPLDSFAQSGQVAERVDDIAYAVDLAAPHVHRPIDVGHHCESHPRRVFDVENVALSGTVAPDRDFPTAFLRVVKLLDQRWNDI